MFFVVVVVFCCGLFLFFCFLFLFFFFFCFFCLKNCYDNSWGQKMNNMDVVAFIYFIIAVCIIDI